MGKIRKDPRLVHALWEIFCLELSLEMTACALAQEVIQNDFGIQKHTFSPLVWI